MFGRRKNHSAEIDEHDQPTEPMARVVLSPFASTFNGSYTSPSYTAESIPSPQPFERPFPRQGIDSHQPQSSFSQPPAMPAYPYPYPAPASRVNGNGLARPTRQTQPRRSPVPGFVGIFFVAVQLLLLVRFVLQLFVQPGSTVWLNVIFGVSSAFVLPFRILLDNVSLPVGADLIYSLAILLAILIYGLFSRILVRFLKALLN